MMSIVEAEPSEAQPAPALTFETARGEDRWKLPPYTADQVRRLPATIGRADVARAFGLSKDAAEEAESAGKFPLQPIDPSRRVKQYLQSELMAALGIPEVPGGAVPPRPARTA